MGEGVTHGMCCSGATVYDGVQRGRALHGSAVEGTPYSAGPGGDRALGYARAVAGAEDTDRDPPMRGRTATEMP